jgi:predicted nuclease of predicted toxin-antitoxin system
MTRFLADENFNHDVLRGLQRRVAHLDIVRVRDVGLRGASDDDVLAHAGAEDRVLLTHDVSTLVAECATPAEYRNQVLYLPLR